MRFLCGCLFVLLVFSEAAWLGAAPVPRPQSPTVLIVADMEGVMGGADPNLFYGAPEHDSYGRELLTREVNAAIRGAREGGAHRILLSDSHFRGHNLLWAEIAPDVIRLRAHALEGSHTRGEVAEIFTRYHPQAMIMVGYHPMAGGSGFLPHTFVTRDIIEIDDRGVGEIAMLAAVAGHFGVPVVMVSGDTGATQEARQFLPGVYTAAVKTLLPDGWVALEPLARAMADVESAARKGFAGRRGIAPLTPARLAAGGVETWSCTLRHPNAMLALPAGVRRQGARLSWRSQHYLDGYWKLFQVFAALKGN